MGSAAVGDRWPTAGRSTEYLRLPAVDVLARHAKWDGKAWSVGQRPGSADTAVDGSEVRATAIAAFVTFVLKPALPSGELTKLAFHVRNPLLMVSSKSSGQSQPENQQNNENHEENVEKNAGDLCRRCRYVSETKKCCNERDNEEYQSPFEQGHGDNPL